MKKKAFLREVTVLLIHLVSANSDLKIIQNDHSVSHVTVYYMSLRLLSFKHIQIHVIFFFCCC